MNAREQCREIDRLIAKTEAAARAARDRGEWDTSGEHLKRRRALVRLRDRVRRGEREAGKRAPRNQPQQTTEEALLADPLAFPRARSLYLTHGARMHACVFCDAPFRRRNKEPRFCGNRCRRSAVRWRRKLRERLICEGFLEGKSDREISGRVRLSVNVVRKKRLRLGLLRRLPGSLCRYREGD